MGGELLILAVCVGGIWVIAELSEAFWAYMESPNFNLVIHPGDAGSSDQCPLWEW